jgi:hypothetical protein
VLGPLTVTAMTPAFNGINNGWEVNPVVEGPQGFDEGAGDFDASLVPALPHAASPGESIVKPTDGYQFCCLSKPWKGAGLAVFLLPELRPVWNNEAFFEYVDRWVSHGTWTQPDPCAPHDGTWANYGVTYGPDGSGGCIPDTDPSDGTGRFPGMHGDSRDDGGYGSQFADDMWAAHR